MKTKLIALALFASLIFPVGACWAGEKETDLKLKSEGVAWALGLDPIPGDALFYAGKPFQGIIDLFLGVPGALLLYRGSRILTRGDSPNCDKAVLGCSSGWGKIAVILGVLFYTPSLLWDAIGGIGGVQEHNDRVRKQALLGTLHPMLSVTDNGAFGGVQITF
jgi:hypothetical protein